MFKEFKQFISKGNVIELAVGLIMATYFGAIVKSLVDDIIMPPIGKILNGIDFKDLKIIIQKGHEAVVNAEGIILTPEMKEISLNYGAFINTVITFLIVAFSVFLIVKAINKMKNKKEEKEVEPPKPSNEEVLLTEIRDLLKNK
jgi:large conductance mechanosensitive channel